MSDRVVLLSEPLLRPDFSQVHLVAPLAASLSESYDVAVAAPSIGPEVTKGLEASGVTPISGGVHFPPTRSDRDEAPAFVTSWLHDAILGTNARWTERRLAGRDGLRINLAMTNSARCDIRFVQSQPLAESVAQIAPNFAGPMRGMAEMAIPALDLLDRRHIRRAFAGAGTVYTSTRFVAERYARRGYRISGQIPVFFHPCDFAPTTRSPSRDYALVYLGKETDMEAVRDLIELGIPLRFFGGKSARLVAGTLGHDLPANVTMCGTVSHRELLELYTNALFTAFPFTDESFGLVPVESMACATPVLTYDRQGPGETVLDGLTGWLASGPRQFIRAAKRLFDRGYPAGMEGCCVARARSFTLPAIVGQWHRLIDARLDGLEPTSPLTAANPLSLPSPQMLLPIRDLVGPV